MITKALKNFNLRQIADSGQCFRMVPCDPNRSQAAYRVISSGHFLIVEQNRDEVIFHCPDDEFAFWEHYFDLESIFTTYISMTDNPEETELLEKFQKLLYQTKEAERNKARFKP